MHLQPAIWVVHGLAPAPACPEPSTPDRMLGLFRAASLGVSPTRPLRRNEVLGSALAVPSVMAWMAGFLTEPGLWSRSLPTMAQSALAFHGGAVIARRWGGCLVTCRSRTVAVGPACGGNKPFSHDLAASDASSSSPEGRGAASVGSGRRGLRTGPSWALANGSGSWWSKEAPGQLMRRVAPQPGGRDGWRPRLPQAASRGPNRGRRRGPRADGPSRAGERPDGSHRCAGWRAVLFPCSHSAFINGRL
jgi:hypothetical protein